jgi:signal peptidase I
MMTRQRVIPLLHPGPPHTSRGGIGIVLIVGLFAVFAAIGISVASLHHGIGPSAHTFEVSVTGGSMSPNLMNVRDGDQVILSVTSDRSGTLVLEGYDERLALIPGVAVAATFVAGKAGKFDFVLEGSNKKLGELDVAG